MGADQPSGAGREGLGLRRPHERYAVAGAIRESKVAFMNIALVQKRAVPNDRDGNLALAVRYIREARAMGADLVLFPEMWSHGYAPPFDGAFDDPMNPAFEEERKAWLKSAVSVDGDYVTALREAAARQGIGVCATFLASSAEGVQNAAVIIDRRGNLLLNYAKVHTCDFSLEKLLRPGREFKVCDFDGVQLGVMICYDREFPESARILMLKGAEIILVPNACDMNPPRMNQLGTRAFENMVGVAMANYPGEGWGGSCAFSPVVFDEDGHWRDHLMVRAGDVQEDILLASFDMDVIRAYRERETWGNAWRKPAAYADLVSTEVKKPFVRNG